MTANLVDGMRLAQATAEMDGLTQWSGLFGDAATAIEHLEARVKALTLELEAANSSHRDLAYRLAEMGRERDEVIERAAEVADDRADAYDAAIDKHRDLQLKLRAEGMFHAARRIATAIRQLKEQQG